MWLYRDCVVMLSVKNRSKTNTYMGMFAGMTIAYADLQAIK